MGPRGREGCQPLCQPLPPQCPGYSRRAGIEPPSRPLPAPPWSHYSFPIKYPLGAQRCSGWGFSSEHGFCSPGQVYALTRSGMGSGLGHYRGQGYSTPLHSPPPRLPWSTGVPGVSPHVEKGEAGVELPMGPPDWRLSVGGGAWYAGHSTCVMVPHGPSCFSILSLSLRSFSSGPSASQGLAPAALPQEQDISTG